MSGKRHMILGNDLFWAMPPDTCIYYGLVCFPVYNRNLKFLCQGWHIFYCRFIPFVTCPPFVRYFFQWIYSLSASVVNEAVGGSVLGVSECGGGLNDVKVLRLEDGGLEWWK